MDISPRHLEHQVYVPTAITLNRLTPQPTRPHINSTESPYKSFKAKEIHNAQTKARHAILQSRLDGHGIAHELQCQGNCCKCRDVNVNLKLKGNDIEPVKNEKSCEEVSIPKTKVSLNVAIGKGESNMRIRQVTRLTNQICDCIKEIEATNKTKIVTKKEFITPYEMEVKRKRLEEYLNSGRRTLFTLKREINHLEGNVVHRKRDCKWLRLLSTASRTLHQLLLGLKNHSSSTLRDSVGLKFYNELLRIFQRLFSVATTAGIKINNHDLLTKQESQFSNVENTVTGKPSITHKDSIDSSSDLLHSNLDDDCLALLHPNNIRERIAALAKASLSHKEKGMNRSEIKILAPLSQAWTTDEDEPNQKTNHRRKQKKKLKRSGSQKRSNSHSRSNDLIQIVPKKNKNVLPTRILSSCKNTDSEDSEINDHKNLLIQYTIDKNDKLNNGLPGNQKEMSPDALMTQIHYLFERVCKINEEWDETKQTIVNISSHEDTEDPQVANQLILNDAQRVLRGIQVDTVDSLSLDIQNENGKVIRLEKKASPIIEYSNNPIIMNDTWRQDLLNTEYNYLGNKLEEKDIYIQNDNTRDRTESALYLSLNTIQDQVRMEKEQFWAALVKRGIVDTDHSFPVETKVISDLYDHMRENKIRKDDVRKQMEQININNPKSDGKNKIDLPINVEMLNKKVQTKPLKEKVKHFNEKEIQVGGTLAKSYSTSFATDTEYSNTYQNQREHSETETTSKQLPHHEKVISSNDNIYTTTDDQVSDIISKQLQRNDELNSSNGISVNSQESKSNNYEISNDKYSQSKSSDESAI